MIQPDQLEVLIICYGLLFLLCFWIAKMKSENLVSEKILNGNWILLHIRHAGGIGIMTVIPLTSLPVVTQEIFFMATVCRYNPGPDTNSNRMAIGGPHIEKQHWYITRTTSRSERFFHSCHASYFIAFNISGQLRMVLPGVHPVHLCSFIWWHSGCYH